MEDNEAFNSTGLSQDICQMQIETQNVEQEELLVDNINNDVPILNNVSDILNEENKKSKLKIKFNKIKEILNKSLTLKGINSSKLGNINFNSIEDMVKNFKLIENNLIVLERKQILYHITLGKIIKNIKIIHPIDWKNVLNKNKISYSLRYLNFLIQLYKLFEREKRLYNSSLKLSFFKKNFTIIEKIVTDGF